MSIYSEKSPGSISLAEIENRAQQLMAEIQSAIFKTDQQLWMRPQDSENFGENIKKNVESMCVELNSVKDDLYKEMLAMEANAGKLENQKLNNLQKELQLKRAAEIATAEAHRLKLLIEKINRILNEAGQAIATRDNKSDWITTSYQRSNYQDQFYAKSDLNYILAGFDYARGFPTLPDGYVNQSPVGYNLEPPLLGNAPPSSLENTLSKIPGPCSDTVEIHADPYSGELYVKDSYLGRVKVDYDRSHEVAGPMAAAARYSGRPIKAQVGYDGSYQSKGLDGMLAQISINPVGYW